MILNYFSKNATYEDIKSKIKLEDSGVSAYEIIKIAKNYNLKGIGYKNYKINNSSLFPFIAHIIKNNIQHFVVVSEIKNKNILISDPAYGKYWISINDFKKNYTGIAIVFKNEKKLINNKIINKKFMFLITFIALFFSFLNISYSYLLSYLFENYKQLKNITYILISILLIGFTKEIIDFIKNRKILKQQLLIDKAITIPTLKKIINLPQNFYNNKSIGELITKFNDLSYLKEMIFSFNQILLVNLLIIFISFIFLLFVNTSVLILNIFISFIIFIFLKKFYNKNSYKNYDLQVKNEVLNSKISNTIQTIDSIKNLAKEKYIFSKLKLYYDDILYDYKNLSIMYQDKNLIIKLIIFITIFITIIFLINNNTSIALMFFIINLEIVIFDSINSILNLWPLYINYKASYTRINELFKLNDISDNGNLFDVKDIYFENITYKLKNQIIFKNFTLKLNKGDFILLTGSTGSGKTTLFKILTKQLKGDKNIYINNKSLCKYDLDSIRKTITYVEQKNKLFNDTILENIILDKSLNLRKNFKHMLDDELSKNKLSYDICVDSSNSNLSEGQLALIKIAQVLNNSGSVIIFDETTSHMDVNLERRVLNSIKEDYKDKIIIFVSHRLSNKDLFTKIIDFTESRRKNETIK